MKRLRSTVLLAALALAGTTLAAAPPAGARSPAPEPAPTAADIASAADAYVAGHPGKVHRSPDDTLVRKDVERGADGLRYVSYERRYGDLPVVGGDVVVMTDADGSVLSASVAQDEAIDTGTKARVGAGKARAVSRKQLPEVTDVGASRLVVLAWGEPRLAWETVVSGATRTAPSKLHVFVDARTGAVAASYDEVRAGTGDGFYNGDVTVDTTGSGSSFSMDDPGRPGIQCGGQGGSPYTGSDDNWGNGSGTSLETACVDALYAVQQEWEMLGDWLGRDGIDGDGGGFPARVGLNQVNAYWNGSYTNFGHSQDGQRQATPMDVVGHEFGHAIFQTTPGGAGYGNENGGLNEATGDIFGALTEAYANNPNDPADYLVGEEVDLVGSGPIRNMYDPSRKNHPNCYSSDIPRTEVHAAAGPLNHWFYLTAEGSAPGGGKPSSPTCDGGSVTGIGLQQAGEVYYNALLQKTSSWRYVDVRVATLNAAKQMFTGCTEFNRIKAAWNSVSVPAQSGEPTCEPQADHDFSVSVSPASGSVDAGGSLTASVATEVTKGNAQQVALSASGLPQGVTAAFDPETITSGGSAELTLSAAASAASGQHRVTITAAGTEITRTATFELTVNGTSSCQGAHTYTGQLSDGQVAYQPDGSYFQSAAGGHSACLDGPEGTDFDLYLQRWNGYSWTDVAQGTSPGPDEELTYTGSTGYYRYQVHSYSGSGSYTLSYDTP
ncbi:M4 family metallopeptidase [Streptomyces sp. MAR4 CNX-425]|uniref:M4 family metallopeptidase n=1 Tax=Streptomyces sp. MAR4 CNX-425 TaxID=3406343 RepID=UPI003B50D10B